MNDDDKTDRKVSADADAWIRARARRGHVQTPVASSAAAGEQDPPPAPSAKKPTFDELIRAAAGRQQIPLPEGLEAPEA